VTLQVMIYKPIGDIRHVTSVITLRIMQIDFYFSLPRACYHRDL